MGERGDDEVLELIDGAPGGALKALPNNAEHLVDVLVRVADLGVNMEQWECGLTVTSTQLSSEALNLTGLRAISKHMKLLDNTMLHTKPGVTRPQLWNAPSI